MKKFILVPVGLALLTFFACSTADTTRAAHPQTGGEIPLRDFFKNPQQGRYELSPDGKTISFMRPWNNRMNVFVQALSADRLPQGEAKQLTFVKDRDIAGYTWKGNHTILYSRDFGGDENFHVFATDVQTGTEKDVTPFDKTRASILDDLEESSDTDVLLEMNKRNAEIFDVYRYNTATGELKLVAQNPGKYTSWLTDHAGHLRVALETDGLTTKVYTRPTEDAAFKRILKFDYRSEFDPILFTPDDKALVAASNLGRDKSALVQVDPKTGKEQKLLFAHPEVDVAGVGYSKRRKVLTAAEYTTWKTEFNFFDPISEARYNKIKAKIGDAEVFITGHNKDEDLFTVVATSDRSRGRYYLYDDTHDRLTFLSDSSPWLDPDHLAEMKPIKYQSRDGLVIHGYLTLPPG
jgi:dipeptidyl aminopeptidase/acylaminoacyl peptidase